MFTITVDETLTWSERWKACPEALDWLRAQEPTRRLRPRSLGVHHEWVAWFCYHAGCDWPDARYTPAIAQAMIETGTSYWLSLAGLHWPDARYTPAFAEALIAIGSAIWLAWAGRSWPEARRGDLAGLRENV